MRSKIREWIINHPLMFITILALLAIIIGLVVRPLFISLTSSGIASETVEAQVEIEPVESNINDPEVTIEPTVTPVPMMTVVRYDVPLSEDHQEFVREVAAYYNFDEELIYQIMKAESDFDSTAISHTNDHGIMQINKQWYSGYIDADDGFNYVFDNGVDLYDIKQNVVIGVRELDYWRTQCLDRGYESVQSVLECYNRGFNYFKNTSYTRYSDNVFSKEIPSYTIEIPVEI